MRLHWNNLVLAAGVSVRPGTEQTQFPATNLLSSRRSLVWQSGITGTGETLVFDLGSAQAVSSVILLDLSVTTPFVTAFVIQGNSSDSWGAPAFSTDIINLSAAYGLDWEAFASITYRYWRLVFTKVNAADVISLAGVFLGTYYDTPAHVSFFGWKRDTIDLSLVSTSPSGVVYADVRPQIRQFTRDFDKITEAQMAQLETIFESNGRNRPIYFRMHQESTAMPDGEVIYGRFRSDLKATVPIYDYDAGVHYADVRIDLEEAV